MDKNLFCTVVKIENICEKKIYVDSILYVFYIFILFVLYFA